MPPGPLGPAGRGYDKKNAYFKYVKGFIKIKNPNIIFIITKTIIQEYKV
jgi:hypothetical protein